LRPKARLSLALALAVSSPALSVGGAFAQVAVTGNVRVDADSIRAHVPVGKDGRVSEAAMDDAVKSIFASGQFDDVKVERSGKGVKVTVAERPVLAAIRFEGNSRLKADRLREASGLATGRWIAEGDLEAAAAALSQAYASSGLVDALVSVRKEETSSGLAVTFRIDEGAKTGVSHVWFRGNDSFSDARLRSVVSTKRSGWLAWLKNNDVYNPDRAAVDREALRRFYLSEGFADVRVMEPEVDRLDDGFSLGFVVEEGPRYLIAVAEADSSAKEFDAAGHPAVSRLEGRVLDSQALAKAAAEVEDSASRAGVPSPLVEPRVTRGEDGRAEVRFTVDPRPRVYVDRVEIEGNESTRDYVIRRELDLAEGDALDRSKLRQAERRLKALGIFGKVAISVLPGGAEDRAVVRIVAEDRKTGEFSVGGGYSTKDGPIASVSVSQDNIAGTGRKGRLHAARGNRTSSYGASFTEPWFLGSRASATVDAYHARRGRESYSTRAYDEMLTGARVTFSAPLSERFGGSVGYRLEQQEISGVDPLFAGTGAPGDPNLVEAGRFLRSSLFWELEYDALDDAASPRDGYRLGFRQEIAGLGGDARFLKTEASGEWYRQLVPAHDLVGRLGAKGGLVSGMGKPLSFLDHYRGGSDVVRGFERDGFGPHDALTGFHLGGTAFVSATAEASMPIPFIPPDLGFRGAAFADAGTVWSPDASRVAASGATVAGDGAELRAALGVGVLWNSPFGMLRADFAVPVARQDGDRTQVFSFSGGTRF